MARAAPKPRLSVESAELAWILEHTDCGACLSAPATQWHHIFPQSRWPEFADEPHNIVAVCDLCHARHTNAFKRFPRRLCKRAELLPMTDQMLAYLDRVYPD